MKPSNLVQWRSSDINPADWSISFDDVVRAYQIAATTHSNLKSIDVNLALEIRNLIINRHLSVTGFTLIRNFPIDKSNTDATKREFMFFANLIGKTIPQDSDRNHVGILNVTSRGTDWRDSIPFHTDGGDLLLLLCIAPPMKGGMLKLAASTSILQTMQREYPDCVHLLFEDWRFHRGERPGAPYFTRPIYTKNPDSTYDCFFLPGTLRRTQEKAGIKLSPTQSEAISRMEEIAQRQDHSIQISLSEGDLLVINNKKILHARTAYEDNPSKPARLIYRAWVDMHHTEAKN